MKKITEREERFIEMFQNVDNFQSRNGKSTKIIFRAGDESLTEGKYSVHNKFGKLLTDRFYEMAEGNAFGKFPQLFGEDTYFLLHLSDY